MESEFDFDLTMNDELGGKIHVHSSQINRENFRFSFVGFLLFPSSLESFVSFVSMMVMCDGDKERVLNYSSLITVCIGSSNKNTRARLSVMYEWSSILMNRTVERSTKTMM
mmetsp:Transcript_31562/g.76504  ORF Transcript_31562/g.76504 Transcript_31562/m.76504 type:complete len:111 (-) Transcript_31562:81-413(-)